MGHAQDPWLSDETESPDFKPWSAEQAQNWRRANPGMSPWRVLGWQGLVGVLMAVLVGAVTGSMALFTSVAYGAMCVILPGAVLARGLSRQMRKQLQGPKGNALVGLLIWESAKIGLTLAMLLAAPMLVTSLNWLALVAGFVVTMKVVWVAVWLRPKTPQSA